MILDKQSERGKDDLNVVNITSIPSLSMALLFVSGAN